MPIPSSINDLSTTPASNYPSGTDAPSVLDDVQRVHGSFIAKIRDLVGLGTGTYVPATAIANMGLTPAALSAAPLASPTFTGTVTAPAFSGPLTGNVTGNASGTAANVTGTVALANGGTGQTTAANAAAALGTIGAGQTIAGVARALNTNYQNLTGRTIIVMGYCTNSGGAQFQSTVDGKVVGYVTAASGSPQCNFFFAVPNNAFYDVSLVAGSGSLTTWWEIR